MRTAVHRVPARPRARLIAAAAVLGALAAAPLPAQERRPPPDTLPPPPTDSLPTRPDTTPRIVPPAPDTAAPRVLPISTPQTPAGPLAPDTRLTFTRDSLVWTTGYTLADLLGEIPGVYVARGGFLGQPTPATYAGRGTTAIEIYWDGVPMLPIGPDSVAVDPGRISLFPLRQVEVEVLPARLRVHLVSERHEIAATRSVLRIVTGDFATGAYAGLFQHRWRSGIGINFAADFLGTEGARDPRRDATWFDLWAKGEWTPTANTTASLQIRRQSYQRDPTGATGTPLVPGREGRRTDVLVRLATASRPHASGWWWSAGMATTGWRPDSASPDTAVQERTFRRAYAALGFRNRTTSAEVRGRVGDHFTTAGADARLGWTPFGGLVLSADLAAARHRGDRTSRSVHAVVGLYRGPFSLTGEIASRNAVPAPAITADTARRTTDYGVRAGFRSRALSGRVGVAERDAFDPLPFTAYPGAAFRPSGKARYVVADATLRLGAWTLDGWYSNPTAGQPTADFQPPKHGRAAITFRSGFIRTFRSGAFDLKVQIAMESWSTGAAGADADGAPVDLIGATFYEAFLQLRLVAFHLFYSLKNAYNSREQFVPGLEYPRNIQTFGVKWVFAN